MNKAESILMSNPDSTLLFLSQIPESNKLKGRKQAKYCLLYTAATFRNYEIQSDSMISIAVRFYERNGTKTQQTEAFYYMGCVAEDLKDAPRAQKYYKKALATGEESGNYSLLGRISSRIAMLYTYQYFYAEAIPYYEKAFQYYLLENDTERQSIVLRNMGRTYTMMNESDSAIHYYEKALLTTGKNKQEILSELGDLYITKEQYAKAFEYIRRSLGYKSITSEPYHTYLSYGKLFYLTHHTDSAYYYLNKSLNSHKDETRMDAYEYLAKIKKDENRWEEYAQLQEQYKYLASQINEQTSTKTIAQMEHLYNYQYTEKELTDSKIQNMHKQAVILGCIIIIMILSIILIVTLNYLKKERREKVLQKQRYDNWKKEQLQNSVEQLKQNKLYIAELENKLTEKQASGEDWEKLLLKKEKMAIENLRIEHNQKEKQQIKRQLRNSGIYQKFHSERDDTKATDSDWKELTSLIDHTYPQFTKQLKSLLPKISDIEFKVCCLVKIEVPTTTMANLINRSRQSVTMIRKRLYHKIYGENGSAKDFDDFIASL